MVDIIRIKELVNELQIEVNKDGQKVDNSENQKAELEKQKQLLGQEVVELKTAARKLTDTLDSLFQLKNIDISSFKEGQQINPFEGQAHKMTCERCNKRSYENYYLIEGKKTCGTCLNGLKN